MVSVPGLAEAGSHNMSFVTGDLTDAAAVARLCDGAAGLIHCAGLLAGRDRDAFARVNIEGTVRLTRAAAEAGVRRLVLMSSLAAREPALSDYAWSKRGGEEAVAELAGGMSWLALRPPAIYGPGDRATLPLVDQLSRRRSLIPGHPEAKVSLIHVRDVISAIDHVLADATVERVACEIDDGKPGGYSWRELKGVANGRGAGGCVFIPRTAMAAAAWGCEIWSRVAGGPPMLNAGKVAELYHRDWVCRNNLLQELSRWRPQVPFAQGFAETLGWYRQAGWLSQAAA